jgi:Protein of unknown function (DUF664)/Bacterial regulatory proteins, gntR family
MLGVSRSPVREALMRLVEADMIKLERNRGFRVVIPGPANIVDAFQLRLLLEVPAACRAALTVREAFRHTLRWVIAHMTSETARHAGHADILGNNSTTPPVADPGVATQVRTDLSQVGAADMSSRGRRQLRMSGHGKDAA